MVYNNNKKLKGNHDKMFICENLTRHRYGLLQRLNTYRKNNRIHSFWTYDGSIIGKKFEDGPTKVVTTKDEVEDLAFNTLAEELDHL